MPGLCLSGCQELIERWVYGAGRHRASLSGRPRSGKRIWRLVGQKREHRALRSNRPRASDADSDGDYRTTTTQRTVVTTRRRQGGGWSDALPFGEWCRVVLRYRKGWRTPTRATLTEQVREHSFVNLGCAGGYDPRVRRPSRPATTCESVGIHVTTFRVNVRWVTPLGEETASTS